MKLSTHNKEVSMLQIVLAALGLTKKKVMDEVTKALHGKIPEPLLTIALVQIDLALSKYLK